MRKQKIYFILIFLSALLIMNCEKEDIAYDNKDPDTEEQNDSIQSDNTDTLSQISDSYCPKGFWYDWNCYENTNLVSWGLGDSELFYIANDKDHNWYIDQANTGPASNNNCGPSSVTMACLWFDKDFPYTAEDARNVYPQDNGWWYTSDIINYLDLRAVPNSVYEFVDSEQLIDLLNDGNIIILCLTMAEIRYNSMSEERKDRFYNYSSGHFLVVKGARTTDRITYFEVYDPNNWHATYSDQSEKGKNRHYRSDDLSRAISEWWNYLIVVSPDSGEMKAATQKYLPVSKVEIQSQWGK